jgi:hypothetical protein
MNDIFLTFLIKRVAPDGAFIISHDRFLQTGGSYGAVTDENPYNYRREAPTEPLWIIKFVHPQTGGSYGAITDQNSFNQRREAPTEPL